MTLLYKYRQALQQNERPNHNRHIYQTKIARFYRRILQTNFHSFKAIFISLWLCLMKHRLKGKDRVFMLLVVTVGRQLIPSIFICFNVYTKQLSFLIPDLFHDFFKINFSSLFRILKLFHCFTFTKIFISVPPFTLKNSYSTVFFLLSRIWSVFNLSKQNERAEVYVWPDSNVSHERDRRR